MSENEEIQARSNELDEQARDTQAFLQEMWGKQQTGMIHVPQLRAVRQRASDVEPEELSWLWEHRIPRGKFTVLDGQPGLGKAERATSKVLTPEGWSPIGELQVGDQVIGSDGRGTEVLGVYPRGEMDLFRVTMDDGAWVDVAGDHLWTVRVSNEKDSKWQTIDTNTMIERSWLLKNGSGNPKKKWRIPLVAPVQHPEADLPVGPYTLGALLGDGSIGEKCGSVTLVNPDEWIAGQCAEEGYEVRRRERDNGCPIYSFPGSGLSKKLDEIGCRKLSHEKSIPEQYLTASVRQRLALLNGLMDTDGSVVEATKRGANHVEYSSSSRDLAEGVVTLVRSLGGVATIHRNGSWYNNEDGVRVEARDRYRVNVKMPNGINPFSLPRKADAVTPRTKYQATRRIANITPAGRDQVVCIRVAAEDSLYVTKDYIVTHNSSALIDIASRISAGVHLPFENIEREPEGVLLLSCEDGLADTTVPRLRSGGADLEKVEVFNYLLDEEDTPQPVLIPDHIPHIREAVRDLKAGLVVIDPLVAYFGDKVDNYKDKDVRRALRPLVEMSEEEGCAIVAVRHPTKGGGNIINRGGGSIGIIGAARTGMYVARDPEDESCSILAVTKSNIAKHPQALRYRLVDDPENGCAHVSWESTLNLTADDLIATEDANPDSRQALIEAMTFLRDVVEVGAISVEEVMQEAKRRMIDASDVKKAKRRLKLREFTARATGKWSWGLPLEGSPHDLPE